MNKLLTIDELEYVGESMITIKGTDQCLGSLLHFDGRTFCPRNGLVPVSKEAAEVHNKALDEALIRGLDETCQIGQGNMFYFCGGQIRTFSGMIVADDVRITGRLRKTVYTTRKDRRFRGVLRKNRNSFFLKRIA